MGASDHALGFFRQPARFGRAGSIDLAKRVDLVMGSRVLDIGGEIDGAARTLAAELGCVVVVLVFAEDFCELGAILTAFTRLSDQVSFHVRNAVAAPFPDVSFDAVCKAPGACRYPRVSASGATNPAITGHCVWVSFR